MKLGTGTRNLGVTSGAADYVKKICELSEASEVEFGLLLTLAELAEDIAAGSDVYAIFGATKDRTAYSLTIKLDGLPHTTYGMTFQELNQKLYGLQELL